MSNLRRAGSTYDSTAFARALRSRGVRHVLSNEHTSCRSDQSSSKQWWHRLAKETPGECGAHARLVRASAALYAGVSSAG